MFFIFIYIFWFQLGGSSPYPVFMLHAALCSSSGLPKPNLENTTDNQSTRRDNVEQIKLSMKEEIQQLEQKMLELKALPKPDMEKTTDNQSARREEDVERFKSQNEDVNQQLKLNSENAEKLNGKSDSIFSRISALIVGVVCALIYSQFIISKR